MCKKKSNKKVDIIRDEFTKSRCWICNSDAVMTRCQNKMYFGRIYCQNCMTKTFVHSKAFSSYQCADFSKGNVVVDTVEQQNFEEIEIQEKTDCPLCEGTLHVKKSRKKIKTGKRGRPRYAIGRSFFCACKKCHFSSYVLKGLGKYIYL